MKKDLFSEIAVGKGKDKKLLSPQQKEFNRLTKKIADQRVHADWLKSLGDRLHQRSAKEMTPLILKHQEQRAELVRLLDRMFRTHKFSKAEIRKLSLIITQISFDLANAGFEDLKEMYNRHSQEDDFEATSEEVDEIVLLRMKEMASSLFGIEIEEDADVDTPEKMHAYIVEKKAERAAKQEQEAEKTAARRAGKPKSDQQLKAEAKRAAQEEKRKEEEKKISQSVREVYMDLVKAFHPDREPDEAEKIRKTAILQRVTAAYEDNDLLALLQLQLELERIDGTHLDNLADDKLRYFNKSLKSQVAELEEELWELEAQLAQMANLSPFDYFNPFQLEAKFEKSIKAIKKELKGLREELESLREPEVLRVWLRHVQVEEE